MVECSSVGEEPTDNSRSPEAVSAESLAVIRELQDSRPGSGGIDTLRIAAIRLASAATPAGCAGRALHGPLLVDVGEKESGEIRTHRLQTRVNGEGFATVSSYKKADAFTIHGFRAVRADAFEPLECLLGFIGGPHVIVEVAQLTICPGVVGIGGDGHPALVDCFETKCMVCHI